MKSSDVQDGAGFTMKLHDCTCMRYMAGWGGDDRDLRVRDVTLSRIVSWGWNGANQHAN